MTVLITYLSMYSFRRLCPKWKVDYIAVQSQNEHTIGTSGCTPHLSSEISQFSKKAAVRYQPQIWRSESKCKCKPS